MKFENTEVWGFKHALRGMRNPMNSWAKGDSFSYTVSFDQIENGKLIDSEHNLYFYIGNNDLKLARTLIKAGSEHRKFLRQIFVSVDITAPIYWWSEFDTYKVGTTANSTSKMHKIQANKITVDCFETDDYKEDLELADTLPLNRCVTQHIENLEQMRLQHLLYAEKSKNELFTESERKHYKRVAKWYWKELIRWLPESWLQTRTVTMTYENIYSMLHQREYHKLNEWSGIDNPENANFIAWVKSLPYVKELFLDKEVVS